MARSQTINEEIRLEVYRLLGAAKKAGESGDIATSTQLANEAWSHIPEPKFGWDVTYVCIGAMVKLLRRCGQHDQAMAIVNGYLQSPYYLDYQDGPHFWLGTLQYEKGDLAAAYQHFERANRMSRGRCFVEEDSKYKGFFKMFKTSGKPN